MGTLSTDQQQILDYTEISNSTQRPTRSRDVISFLKDHRESISLRGVEPSALAYLLASMPATVRKPILVVTATDHEAEELTEAISFFRGGKNSSAYILTDQHVRFFPSRSGYKAQLLGKMESTARRLEALYTFRTSRSPGITVASALALLELTPPPSVLLNNVEYRVVGEKFDLDAFVRDLSERGYCGVSLVEEYGDFSRRGNIVDIYAPLYRWPVRLEFFDDELESIRLFHPTNQRSVASLEDVIFLPGSEIILDSAARERIKKEIAKDIEEEKLTPAAANVWLERIQEGYYTDSFERVLPLFYEETSTLFDYLSPDTVIVWSDVSRVQRRIEEHYAKIERDTTVEHSPHEWRRPSSELFIEPRKLDDLSGSFQNVWVNDLIARSGAKRIFDLAVRNHIELAVAVTSQPGKERLLEPLARQFRTWQQEAVSSFLVCTGKEQAKRLADLLCSYGVDAVFTASPFGEESYNPAAVKVVAGSLEKGFIWPAERLSVVCEEEIFGKRSRRRSKKPLAGIFLNSFRDLHVGDYVVHVDHGIGIYKELVRLDVRGIGSDFLLIEYQGGDRLYVPVNKLHRVQKYLGIEGQEPRIDKLGGKAWENAKKKARESAERVAEELLDLYALRQVREGFRFSLPDDFFKEFEATFVYEETPDQMDAIEDVLNDMASPQPMDRLVCGDVGYGKTEVALRAAFKAIMDGKQVAMLVPTTVLAEQHYQTFAERFEGFPVKVASLSRFKTQRQQKQVLDGLKRGTIDFVVGTHRLLQKDVSFKDLGLLIIDEEHRFGVRHKEKLKQLRISVDVLTLTATPIPRTLQMSLAGIRDLSTIETAPLDRRAIETYVCDYDEATIKEAIYRELERKGQVFFVHNHVQSITRMANTLKKLVPEARVAVAHGQMSERDLEKVMLNFVHKEIDVLVCTTIIESGLDIPSANTIIINRADKFGLAQIYQLRGRVGRASEQAYAYLIIPGEHVITRDARKRLRALMDFSELGAGFRIALNDLQIRGGGSILGSAQSGHIAAVGYELYLELLEKTIRKFKGEDTETESLDPEINVMVSAFLPESFISDNDQRLLAYKRLATIAEERDIDDLISEWRDRFGPLPESAKNLILLAKLRLLLKRNRILRLEGDKDVFTLYCSSEFQTQELAALLQEKKCDFRVEATQKVSLEIWGRNVAQRLARLKRILKELSERASDSNSIK